MDERKCQSILHEKNKGPDIVYQGTIIGDLTVFYTEMRETVEIGYTFHPEYGGQGFATEALQTVITQLFQQHNIHRIQAILDKRNQASENVCLRLGMRKEGDFKEDFWNKGEWTDTLIYGLLAKEWQNKKR
jgi:RimJ/RimL family protein N-acetyltransferase